MASREKFEIDLTPTAIASLRRIRDKKLLRRLAAEIDLLATEARSGKPLEGALSGLLSCHAARDRWRIVYEARDDEKRVIVHFVGRRRPGRDTDVYVIAARLLRELAGAR